ncbi:uncharacterized protein LOC125884181 isoform X2 [Xyrichtys novacula]|uniref:Uncharacterized protein LOC125884181 isoform X2 n=1 Tax=Xyrichtys novacula TaxID=13765 RepID=A0AAV1HIF9_XYRNO|nr:uncharacterized protein LOC125884181 isoform X2 [Xyrichtys novacula]
MNIMTIITLCAVIATLRVQPNRSQFFSYGSVSLSCEFQGNSSGWTVKRNTLKNTNESCHSGPNKTKSFCSFPDLYPFDSGKYWCESAAGGCSEAVNITVTDDPVILESPALPVEEGDIVTLGCKIRATDSIEHTNIFPKNHTAHFYKDGLLIGSSSTGNRTIHRVSKSDEGFYSCNISGVGHSKESWLTVRGRPEVLNSPFEHARLPVVVVCLLLISVISVTLLCLWRSHKGKVDPDLPYTDVTITQGVQPNRITDVGAVPTFYSTVKPENT